MDRMIKQIKQNPETEVKSESSTVKFNKKHWHNIIIESKKEMKKIKQEDIQIKKESIKI